MDRLWTIDRPNNGGLSTEAKVLKWETILDSQF